MEEKWEDIEKKLEEDKKHKNLVLFVLLYL